MAEGEDHVNFASTLGNAESEAEALYQNVMEKQDEPLRVARVSVEGNFRTADDFLEAELDALRGAGTLGEVLERSHEVAQELEQLNIFSRAEIELVPGPENGTADAILHVREKSGREFRAGTFFENGEASFEVAGSLTNSMGRAERVEARVNIGQPNKKEKRSATCELSYTKPRFLKDFALSVQAVKSLLNNSELSSHCVDLHGASVELRGERHGALGHAVKLHTEWRDIGHLSAHASARVAESQGNSIKSSVEYVYEMDRRDSPIAPTTGDYVRVSTEVAGLGMGCRFFRHEAETQLNVPLSDIVTFRLSLLGGMIVPFGGDFVRICDRFHAGGPLTFRGFKNKGLGPRAPRTDHHGNVRGERGYDALGGSLIGQATAALQFALPNLALRSIGVYGHMFGSVGNLITVNRGESADAVLRAFGRSLRASVGAGLVVPTPLGRVEVNAARVIRSVEGDRTGSFQVGIGINFT